MAIDGRRGKKPYRARPNRKLTTFPSVKEVIWSPEEGKRWKTPSRGIYRPSPIVQAVKSAGRRYKYTQAASRTSALRQAEAIITIGYPKKSFGKPTLNLIGELNAATHSDQIRRFLHKEGVLSVAFVIAPGQPYWKIFKVVKKAFDWSKNDTSALSDEDRKTIRELWVTGDWTARELAETFGVSQPCITFNVTGHSDKALFAKRHKEGWSTLNSFLRPMVYGADVYRKAEELGIVPERVGPMYLMVSRKDSRRLRDAVRRIAARRLLEEPNRPPVGIRLPKGNQTTFEVVCYDRGLGKQVYVGSFSTLKKAIVARNRSRKANGLKPAKR